MKKILMIVGLFSALFANDIDMLKNTSKNFIEQNIVTFEGYSNGNVKQIEFVSDALNKITIEIENENKIIFQNQEGFIIDGEFYNYVQLQQRLTALKVVFLEKTFSKFYIENKEFFYILNEKEPEYIVIVPFNKKEELFNIPDIHNLKYAILFIPDDNVEKIFKFEEFKNKLDITKKEQYLNMIYNMNIQDLKEIVLMRIVK